MRHLFVWLGVAVLAVLATPDTARAGDPLKPYVVLVFDTSGSMDDGNSATGFGPPSCGGNDTRLDHARCAVSKIVSSYGDMVFALTRFRMGMTGNISGQFPNGCGVSGAGTAGTGTCTHRDDALEVLTPLVDGNNDTANSWVNFTGNTCRLGRCSITTTTSCNVNADCPAAQTCDFATADPELWNGSGNTPIAGSLAGVKQYYSGVATSTNGSTIWPSNLAGFAPIANDPTKLAFIPPDGSTACDPSATCTVDPPNCAANGTCCCVEQCRPYLVIVLTDGDETCSQRCSNNTSQICLLDSECPGGSCDVSFTPAVTDNATALLSTTVEGRRYRIETKPIGFGKPSPDNEIEALAHAGGAIDVAGSGVTEGFYAQNEAELQLAISSILDDALRVESCNGRDDDCDILIDEDFEPAKNEACDNGKLGLCRRTGTLVCKADGTGLECNAATGPNPVAESCNNLDDDCDGKIDEFLVGCSCSPQQEQCNGLDDDCDTRVDEASPNGPKLTRPCNNGVCPGVETCNFAVFGPPAVPGGSGFGGCTAQPITAETCNGLDDNCDGIKDGLQAECSTMSPFPANDDPENNPGHPDNSPNLPENICHPGFKVCPAVAGPPNSFQACQNEVKPCNDDSNNATPSPNLPNQPVHPNPTCLDLCNGLDDDCDNQVDEDFVPADCSSDCGSSQTECNAGVLSCPPGTASGDDDNCNGIDDNCNGQIDEGYVCDTPPNCPCTGSGICNGVQSCVNGVEVCQGEAISQESCDCQDNNCNDQTDEGNLCASGSICNEFCQCAFSCSSGEFPCPLGKFCKTETDRCSTAVGCDASDACTQDPSRTDCCCRSLCIADPCADPTFECNNETGGSCTVDGDCGEGFSCAGTTCVKKKICQVNAQGDQALCVAACDPSVINCAPLICLPESGLCAPDDCTTFPERCAENQNCIVGVCVTNLCQGVDCPTDQYCVAGNCVESCADVECPAGQRCRLGVCEDDPCDAPCPFGQACNDNSGECVADGCGTITCPTGQYCNPNNNGGTCEDDACVGTQCPSADQICLGGTCFDPDDFAPDGGVEVRVTAGGGGCSTEGGHAGLLLVGLAVLWLRRRARTTAAGGSL